jgi:hypothetical protein
LKINHTFELPDSTNGILGANGTDGPEIRFFLRAGSDLVGEDVREAINPNIAGVNEYKIYLAQVQFEYGQDASLFELNDPTSEFNRCLRYYQTSAAATPFRDITSGTAVNADSIPIDGSNVVVRYPVEIRDPNNCTVTTVIDSGSISAITKSKKGFKTTKTGGTLNLNYEVESEL